MNPSLLALGTLLLAASPESQASQGPSAAAPSARAPVEPSSAPAPAPGLPPEHWDGVDGGTGQSAPAVLDDSIPLPQAQVLQPGAKGDTLVEPASGDPFFLGFVAGPYYPPAGEELDPLLAAQLHAAFAPGRPAAVTYGFALFEKRITPARIAELETLGARVLGFHPHYALQLALPPGSAEAIAELDFVRWLGAPRPWQKVHPRLVDELASLPAGQSIGVYVSVHDSDLGPRSSAAQVAPAWTADSQGVREDGRPSAAVRWTSNGWQQAELEASGLEVTEYVDSIRAFRARLLPASLEDLVARDFVLFVEADLPRQLAHDESTPMMLSDSTRSGYDGGTNLAALGGMADSGYYFAHADLNNAGVVGWDLTGLNAPFSDGCKHGSHVAGTIRGEGDVDASLRGNAPGLGWGNNGRFFSVRFFDNACNASGASIPTILGILHSSYTDPGGYVTPRPHVANHSYGFPGVGWQGTEADARTIDNEVYNYLQLHVWAAGNEGPGAGTLRLEAAAKNAFTVGSVVDFAEAGVGDPGSLAPDSSRGPCGDGRWKPNAVAPGRIIRSVQAGTTSGYMQLAGTSMAAPHVTGLAAQIADHFPFARYAPSRLAANLMATALTRDDQALTFPSDAHLDQFGAGRVEAWRNHYGSSQLGWTNWGFDQSGANWVYADFTVSPGATRLVICLTYHEPAASAGASKALVNDFDLWIDSPANGIDPGGNTGEYFAQQSGLDNTEIRILEGPIAGTWRWKSWPYSATSTAHVSVCVSVVYGATKPDGSLVLAASDTYVRPNEDVQITATVDNPSYVASAVFLDSSSAGDSLQAATTTLADGGVTDLLVNQHGGRDLLLGDILHGSSRSARWITRWAAEGAKVFSVEARSDNWLDETKSVVIAVDGTPPGVVGGLASTTHATGVWSTNPSIGYAWTAAPDNLSGIDGYGLLTTTGAAMPAATKVIEEVTSFAQTLPTAAQGWYFNIRAVDNCGNWSGSYATAGPFLIDAVAPLGPSNLSSTTHYVGVQSCSTMVNVHWTPAGDSHSGLAGYLGVWNTSAAFDPTGATNIGANSTSSTTDIGSSSSPRYFHLRAKDVAGNYGVTQHFGPILANASLVAIYCTPKVNSLLCVPAIASTGQPSLGGGGLRVNASEVLNNKPGLLFWGLAPSAAPFQGAWLCVQPPTVRTPPQSSGGSASGNDCSGFYSFQWTTAYLLSQGLTAGDDVYCQYWTRDPQDPYTTGLTDAVSFTICQ